MSSDRVMYCFLTIEEHGLDIKYDFRPENNVVDVLSRFLIVYAKNQTNHTTCLYRGKINSSMSAVRFGRMLTRHRDYNTYAAQMIT